MEKLPEEHYGSWESSVRHHAVLHSSDEVIKYNCAEISKIPWLVTSVCFGPTQQMHTGAWSPNAANLGVGQDGASSNQQWLLLPTNHSNDLGQFLKRDSRCHDADWSASGHVHLGVEDVLEEQGAYALPMPVQALVHLVDEKATNVVSPGQVPEKLLSRVCCCSLRLTEENQKLAAESFLHTDGNGMTLLV